MVTPPDSALSGLYAYANLDAAGEAEPAARRMEARAQDPASRTMFAELLAPLLDQFSAPRVLELGAGTGALARRMVGHHPGARVLATDASAGMMQYARTAARECEGAERLTFAQLDIRTEQLPSGRFDVVVSSVMIPYLADAEIAALCVRAASLLGRGGILAFLEQDLESGSLYPASHSVQERLFGRMGREPAKYRGLGARAALRAAGLTLLPPSVHLWSTRSYGPYLQDLVQRSARAAVETGVMGAAESAELEAALRAAEALGDFHYSLAYHLICATRPT